MSNNFSWQAGRGQLAKLTLANNTGASAEIYRHGAHLTSWKTRSGKEWIFVSEQAVFQNGKAIRGGVPIIFPQFNAFGPGPRHGFARNMEWQLIREPDLTQAGAECTFALSASEQTLQHWTYQFAAEFSVQAHDDQLTMQLTVLNTDTKPFTFTAALHTYFAVMDIHQAQLYGLKNLQYWDNDGSDFQQRKVFSADLLEFPAAIDRVYFACTKPLELIDGENRLQISTSGFNDVVVWNPGAAATKQLSDMADHEYQHMLCIEAAAIDKPITLAPGESWSGAQVLRG